MNVRKVLHKNNAKYNRNTLLSTLKYDDRKIITESLNRFDKTFQEYLKNKAPMKSIRTYFSTMSNIDNTMYIIHPDIIMIKFTFIKCVDKNQILYTLCRTHDGYLYTTNKEDQDFGAIYE